MLTVRLEKICLTKWGYIIQITNKLLMNWSLLKGILWIFIFCSSCNRNLEQKNVLLSFSFRLDNDFVYDQFILDLINLKKLKVQNVGIELIIKNNEKNEPLIDFSPNFDKVLNELKLQGFQSHIILSKWNDEAILIDDTTFLKTWNLKYQKLVSKFLNDFAKFNIKFFIFAVDFLNIEKMPELYKDWVKEIQKNYKIPVVYSTHLHKVLDCPLNEYLDYIGIFYEHEPRDRFKKLARNLHPKISEKFHNKKILITHANVEGKDALLKTQNLLRFWKKNNLFLLNFNSIYNQTVISRDSNYFSLKSNLEFLNYLQKYQKKNK